MSLFPFLSFSESIMHQCGIADLGLKQTPLCRVFWLHRGRRRRAFTNAEQTVQGQGDCISEFTGVPLAHPNLFKFTGTALD